MRISIFLLLFCFGLSVSYGQSAGNTVYTLNGFRLPDTNIQVSMPQNQQSYLKIKGIANVVADSYTAIFSVRQMGKTSKETNAIMNTRINNALTQFESLPDVEVHIDMISFVPVYTFEEQKKIFSKVTYNEVPAGFEMRKNIHIRFKKAELLSSFISALAEEEIYDLVRVDYFSEKLNEIKEELKKKAFTQMKAKIESYEDLLGYPLNTQGRIQDAFQILLPVEQYQKYTAYTREYTDVNRFGKVQKSSKNTTLYYQPTLDKEFDFVINARILEPVIQVMYEIDIEVPFPQKEEPSQPLHKYFLLNSEGKVTELKL